MENSQKQNKNVNENENRDVTKNNSLDNFQEVKHIEPDNKTSDKSDIEEKVHTETLDNQHNQNLKQKI